MKCFHLKNYCLSLVMFFAASASTQAEVLLAPPGYQTSDEVRRAILFGKVKLIDMNIDVPEMVKMEKDVEYGKGGDVSLKLDLYSPKNLTKPAPAVVLIHGGAWKMGHRSMYHYYCTKLAERGYVAVTVSYRLTGVATFPAAVEDVKCAVRWMRANAERLGVDPDRIAAMGGSAGGHLAMLLGYSSDVPELEGNGGNPGVSSRVQAVVNFYGPTDLTVSAAEKRKILIQFMGGKKLSEIPDRYRLASPITHITPDDAPTLILHGSIDQVVPISQSEMLVARLQEVGIPHEYIPLDGWPHGMDLAVCVNDYCLAKAFDFLDEHLVQAKTQAMSAESETVPTALQDYAKSPDDSFAWSVRKNIRLEGCQVHDLDLTSQTWQGITWKHTMSIFVPDNIRHKETALLFITGGSIGSQPDDGDYAMGVRLAKLTQAACVFLHHVPNQPLMNGRKEDDLISETFLRYLKTKDKTWPLLFPMVKSAVRAMDATSEFAKEHYQTEVQQFVVSGASKRGWTSWLTAVADDRVAGIAPMVIDTLNLRKQMQHQLGTWGVFSEQIADYTSKGLVQIMLTQSDVPLWRWVDPYTYRRQLDMPKLLINGTNDRYWVLDAMNLYWDDLVGEKHLLYIPNAGHGLDDGHEGRQDALTTLAVFTQHVAQGQSLPKLTWKHDREGESLRLTVQSSIAPEKVQLWMARSKTKDFRQAEWKATTLTATTDGHYVGQVERPESGHVALYGEATYALGAVSYGLSTQIRRE